MKTPALDTPVRACSASCRHEIHYFWVQVSIATESTSSNHAKQPSAQQVCGNRLDQGPEKTWNAEGKLIDAKNLDRDLAGNVK